MQPTSDGGALLRPAQVSVRFLAPLVSGAGDVLPVIPVQRNPETIFTFEVPSYRQGIRLFLHLISAAVLMSESALAARGSDGVCSTNWQAANSVAKPLPPPRCFACADHCLEGLRLLLLLRQRSRCVMLSGRSDL